MLWIVEKVLSYGAKGPITIVSARLLILQNITFVMNISISREPLTEIRPKRQIFTIVESLNDDNFFSFQLLGGQRVHVARPLPEPRRQTRPAHRR